MPIGFPYLKRVVLVVDNELSTYKGICRICQDLNTEVYPFSCRNELFRWLHNNHVQLTHGEMACCMVLDTKFIDIHDDSLLDATWLCCSKIYISRLVKGANFLRQMNIGSTEFIEKPFRLDVMRSALERNFSFHVHRVEISRQFTNLTKRELETCELLVNGRSTQEIAKQMGIAIKTVKVHRANLMRKIKANSVAELIRDYDAFTSFSSHSLLKPISHLIS